ncbi:WG repeat-containing protein [Ferruginibacter sp. SUN106]|uniref:WG repeat-containing protein n=1 Tax=Ferruginibacter sp. SUN106 TaxID=2978348 RepID=UPI003D368DA0
MKTKTSRNIISSIFLFPLFFPVFLKAQYKYLIPFCDHGTYGYCDTNGVIKIKPQFYNAEQFTLGYAFVDAGGGKNIIDTTGKLLLPVNYARLNFVGLSFKSEIVIGEDYERKGYVYDLQNQQLLNQGTNVIFGVKNLYVENSRYFTINGEQVSNRGIYDVVVKKFIYKTQFSYIKVEEDNEVVKKVKGRSYFVISEGNGNSFFSPQKMSFAYLQNGSVTVYTKPPQKQATTKPEMLKEGMSVSKSNSMDAMIPATDMPKIIPFYTGSKMGIIVNEIKNKIFIKADTLKPVFDSIIFPCGTKDAWSCCFVKLHHQWGVWNWEHDVLTAVVYDTIKAGNEFCNYFITMKNKKSGLLYDTSLLLMPEYDKIEPLNDGGYSLQQNNKYGYFNKYFYEDDSLADRSLLTPCIFDVRLAAAITIYPVNGKMVMKKSDSFLASIEGTPYRILLQSSPGYSANYMHKYVSATGKKFYK